MEPQKLSLNSNWDFWAPEVLLIGESQSVMVFLSKWSGKISEDVGFETREDPKYQKS